MTPPGYWCSNLEWQWLYSDSSWPPHLQEIKWIGLEKKTWVTYSQWTDSYEINGTLEQTYEKNGINQREEMQNLEDRQECCGFISRWSLTSFVTAADVIVQTFNCQGHAINPLSVVTRSIKAMKPLGYWWNMREIPSWYSKFETDNVNRIALPPMFTSKDINWTPVLVT